MSQQVGQGDGLAGEGGGELVGFAGGVGLGKVVENGVGEGEKRPFCQRHHHCLPRGRV